jgi:hypothetical protein
VPFDLSEEYVVQAEAKLGAALPESYRRAMMAENGGEISTEEDDWEQYPILDSSDKKRMSRSINDIISETKSCIGWNGFPENAVAIANNGFGDQMVFLKTGKQFEPTVYFWSHETGELTRLANDFSELNRL